jgi:SSS family solute:Na+ symporter
VNAPLFATFLLGMFWRRSTGHGAFFGLLAGTLAAFLHHGLTLSKGAVVGIKGGYLADALLHKMVHVYNCEMAQNFWAAIWAFSACFIVTVVVSVLTRPRPAEQLVGLVYSLTPKPEDHERTWYKRPVAFGVFVMAVAVVLNIIYF